MSHTTVSIPLFKLTDEELLSAFTGTKEHRFYDELHQRHNLGMRHYIRKQYLNQDNALAQDAVQDAWLGVYKHSEKYESGRGSVKSWLYSLACNSAINIIKSRNRRPTIAMYVELGKNDDVHEMERAENRHLVRAACDMLCPEDREAVMMIFFGGLTHRQAAKQLGIPLSTFKSRLYRGLDSLRGVLRRAA